MAGDKLPPARTRREQIAVARAQLRGARRAGEVERELYWTQQLDALVDDLPRASQ